MKIFAMVLFTVLMAGCASAQTMQPIHGAVPPPDTTMEATWPATLHKAPATELTLGSMQVRFGTTTLQDVLAVVGVGMIEHRGDAGCLAKPEQLARELGRAEGLAA